METLLDRLIGVIAAVAVVGSPAVTSAEPANTMVLVPQISPTAAPELTNRFHESVIRGWRTSEKSPSAAEVRLRLGTSETLLTCGGQAACATQAAEILQASRLVAAELTIAGKEYTVRLRLIDQKGRELLKVDEVCEICTLNEADEAVARAAARLALAARSLPVEPAAVPASKSATEGGRSPPSSARSVPTSSTNTAARPSATKSSFPFRPVAIASAVGGLVLLISGIPLSVIDGRPTCGRPDPVHHCPDVYNTVGGGAALITLGALGLVASVPLFYFDARSRQRKLSGLDLRLGPQRSGVAASLSGRF